MDNLTSFKEIYYKWIPEIRHHITNKAVILLIATRVDKRLEKKQVNSRDGFDYVTTEEGISMAKAMGCVSYLEVSSKEGTGIKELEKAFCDVPTFALLYQRGEIAKRTKNQSCIKQ